MRPQVLPLKAGRPADLRPAMDAAPASPEPGPAPLAVLGAPQAEVLEDVLREQFGPLPHLAAICRLKRLPSGGYSSTEDLQLVLERRRMANAKERERVRGPRGPCPLPRHGFYRAHPVHPFSALQRPRRDLGLLRLESGLQRVVSAQ